MQVTTLVVGPYRTNCYVIVDNDTLLIIDPGYDQERIIQFITSSGKVPSAVLLTHTHWDHIMALPRLKELYSGMRIFVHSEDAPFLGDRANNLQLDMVRKFDPEHAAKFAQYLSHMPEGTDFVYDSMIIDEFPTTIKVIHTPGHTRGSVCYYFESEHLLCSGDTLFAGTIGRTDVPGGSMRSILDSIATKLLVLPGDTKVLTGHGPSTTIGRERQNPWLQPEVL